MVKAELTDLQDFSGLENAKVKFQDFLGFPGPVRALLGVFPLTPAITFSPGQGPGIFCCTHNQEYTSGHLLEFLNHNWWGHMVVVPSDLLHSNVFKNPIV